MLHNEILNTDQQQLLPLISTFKREYYLVGGTAIALYIGHRRSIDFDLFKYSDINHKKNIDKISNFYSEYIITRRVTEQMNLTVNNVKLTFFQYPFHINSLKTFQNCFRMPSLIDLAAMKAYALGRRSKWKDYVDIYFLLVYYFSINEISKRADDIFGSMFSEKLFRAQLSYFQDIDYSEEVDYLMEPIKNDVIKSFLIEKAIAL